MFSIDGCLQGAEDSCIDAIRVTDMEIGKNFQQSISMCAKQPSVYFTEGPYLPLSALYQFEGRKHIQIIELVMAGVVNSLIRSDEQIVVPDSSIVYAAEATVCGTVVT